MHAALSGDLPMLQWARTNGCPWNVMTFRFVRADGDGIPEQGASLFG